MSIIMNESHGNKSSAVIDSPLHRQIPKMKTTILRKLKLHVKLASFQT